MKLFWKIFFSTMFISAVCIVISGYLIIHADFRSQLEREAENAQRYGDIVYYTLASEVSNTLFSSVLVMGQEIPDDTIFEIADSVSADRMNQKILFSVITEEKDVIFSSLPAELDKTMISSLNDENGGWTIKNAGDAVYIQSIRPALLGNSLFYIETLRDVSAIYENQKGQYEMLIEIMLWMILLVGIFTFVIARFLLRQIVELTKITKTIADGNLSVRAVPRGQDEISMLSEHFNSMAETLESNIGELKGEAERKERFVGAFSHELKTPLTSIIGYADLLRRKEMDAQRRHICAEYIFTEGKRLETLSMRLLDLIVLEKHTLERIPADIRYVFEKVRAIVEPQLNASAIELVCDVEPCEISMEPELMKTVFINLIDNAGKAIDGKGKILITGRRTEANYVVAVSDNGRGMEEKELDRITEAFYRVDRSRSKMQGGAGLGLSICDEILKLHGFTISFASEVNIGTTVTITMEAVRI